MSSHDRSGTNDSSWSQVHNAVCFLKALRLIRRFADLRNPTTHQRALPDGSNLESGALRLSWILHRAWIRALHYRSLNFAYSEFGLNQIKQIMRLSAAFQRIEVLEVPFEPVEKHQNPYPEIEFTYSWVLKYLSLVATALFTETRPPPFTRPYTEDETISYNLEAERFAPIVEEAFKYAYVSNPSGT